MGRMRFRLKTGAAVALCLAACLTAGAPAARAEGGRTIAEAPSLKLNKLVRGQQYDGAFYSGYSVAYWTASFAKGDRITIRTDASGSDTPPCQLLYMPGTDDLNVGSTTPLLNPASSSRDGSHDVQRFEPVSQPGTYVLAMSNADIFLSGPLQCLDAPPGRPFTFKVTVAHRGSGTGSAGPSGGRGGGAVVIRSGHASTHVVEPGQSLWVIAEGLVSVPDSNAQVALEVGRLWQLNADRIGTGDPNRIFPGLELRLK